jgi:hypothetical protein
MMPASKDSTPEDAGGPLRGWHWRPDRWRGRLAYRRANPGTVRAWNLHAVNALNNARPQVPGAGQTPPGVDPLRGRADHHSPGPAKTDGIAAGAYAAAAMLAARTGDGRYVPFTPTVGTEPGEWRPTPPAFVNDPFAWVARVEPFVLRWTSQFRTVVRTPSPAGPTPRSTTR